MDRTSKVLESAARADELGHELPSLEDRWLQYLDEKEKNELAVKHESAPSHVTGWRLASIVSSVVFASFLMLLDQMIVSTAIPRITDTFDSLADVGWYASAYQFGSAAPQLLVGKVYTQFKLKWSFLTFFGIFELGSVLCGAAVSSNMLIVGRAIAGFGAAGIMNGAVTIILSCAPPAKRPSLVGLGMGLCSFGLVAGPLVGGAFTSYTSWRWCFYVNLPLGFCTALSIIFLRIPEQMPKQRALATFARIHHHLDLAGFVLFAPAVLQLLLALEYGGTIYPWHSSRVIGLFCGSAATFAVWLLWNYYKGEDALLPRSVFKRRVVWAAGLFQSFVFSAILGLTLYLPLYFQVVKDASPVLSGVYLLPIILAQLCVSSASGVVLQKIGYVIPLAIFGTVLLTIGSGLCSILQPHSPTGYWVGFQLLAGVGSGSGMQLAIIATQAAVGIEQLAMSMAVIFCLRSLFPAIVLALCNVIFLASLSSQLHSHTPQVDAAAIVREGATGFRLIVHSEQLPGVLAAYANSIDKVFYLITGVTAACAIVLWGMGWQDIRKKGSGKKSSHSDSTD